MSTPDPTTVVTVAGGGAASGLVALVSGIDDPVVLLISVAVAAPIALLIRLVWVLVGHRTTTIDSLQVQLDAERKASAEGRAADRATATALRTASDVERDAYHEHLRELEARNAKVHIRLLALEGGPPRDLLDAVEADQVRVVQLLGDTPSGPPE